MVVKIKLSNEVAERWKSLQTAANEHSVKVDEAGIFDDAFSRALDNFEMGDLHAAGHTLPPELEARRQKRIAATVQAKETAEKKRPTLEAARVDVKSLHSVLLMNNADDWNRAVSKLAGVMKAMNIEYKRTKIRDNISDIVIEPGWNENHKRIAEQVFQVKPEIKPEPA